MIEGSKSDCGAPRSVFKWISRSVFRPSQEQDSVEAPACSWDVFEVVEEQSWCGKALLDAGTLVLTEKLVEAYAAACSLSSNGGAQVEQWLESMPSMTASEVLADDLDSVCDANAHDGSSLLSSSYSTTATLSATYHSGSHHAASDSKLSVFDRGAAAAKHAAQQRTLAALPTVTSKADVNGNIAVTARAAQLVSMDARKGTWSASGAVSASVAPRGPRSAASVASNATVLQAQLPSAPTRAIARKASASSMVAAAAMPPRALAPQVAANQQPPQAVVLSSANAGRGGATVVGLSNAAALARVRDAEFATSAMWSLSLAAIQQQQLLAVVDKESMRRRITRAHVQRSTAAVV